MLTQSSISRSHRSPTDLSHFTPVAFRSVGFAKLTKLSNMFKYPGVSGQSDGVVVGGGVVVVVVGVVVVVVGVVVVVVGVVVVVVIGVVVGPHSLGPE